MTSLMQLLMDYTHNERIPRCLDHKSYDLSKSLEEKRSVERCIMQILAKRLKELREERRIYQRELAEILGMSFRGYQNYETGQRAVSAGPGGQPLLGAGSHVPGRLLRGPGAPVGGPVGAMCPPLQAEMTNELLKKNADMLKMGTIQTAKEAERSVVSIETLQVSCSY